jgi:hypothetical protein
MKGFLLNFKLKGNRDYVHGTDIYSKIMEHLNSENFKVSNIDISFHKIATHNLKAELYPSNTINPGIKNLVSIFKFTNNLTKPYIINLFETNVKVTESYAYDEEKIINAAILNKTDKSILLTSAIPYKNVEKIVSLNKALLTSLLSDPGKWYFTRLTVGRDINQQTPVSINLKLIKNIGSKITKTLVLFDEKEQGHIYFSKV